MLGFRSLKYPVPPTHDPDDRARYRRENAVWWDNWSHNFGLSLGLLLVLMAVAVVLVLVVP